MISNCCGERIFQPDTNGHGHCTSCGQHCTALNVDRTPGGYYVTGPDYDGPDSVVGHGTTIHDAFCDYIEQDADANEKYREAA